MSSDPPSWASELVALVVPARHRDGITGDLLEQYHEVELGSRGMRRADRWYVQQVLLLLWRASRWWGVTLGLQLAIRDGVDILMPTHDYYVRSLWTTSLAVSLFATCGLHAGWRYGCVRSGAAVGVAAAAIGSMIALGAPLLYLGAVVASHGTPPYGLREAFDVPAPVLAFVGGAVATLGAAVGKMGGRHRRLTVM